MEEWDALQTDRIYKAQKCCQSIEAIEQTTRLIIEVKVLSPVGTLR